MAGEVGPVSGIAFSFSAAAAGHATKTQAASASVQTKPDRAFAVWSGPLRDPGVGGLYFFMEFPSLKSAVR
jgi:hypothetical protein